jgi:drug/metabolite transporter (DMT)-like permease
MISILLGLVAAFSWSIHDLLARRFAGSVGPYRLSFWIMLAGAALLVVPVIWRGQIYAAEPFSFVLALIMGVVIAVAMASLLLAFSLAPVSIVGPLTAAYPALVVAWGLLNGVVPTAFHWLGIFSILAGVTIVSRFGHDHGGPDSVAPGNMPWVIGSAVMASLAFAAAVILGQAATKGLGEYETTFISRFPAALALTVMMLRDRAKLEPMPSKLAPVVVVMAGCDVVAVTAINAAAWFPHRELGAMAISSYGAISVLLAMVVLKERVTALQWLGILMVVVGLAMLSG